MAREQHEIRVHGVSGTSPEAMLFRDGDGSPVRTASYTDGLTGFYAAGDDRSLEAYSWGALTSGAGRLQEKAKRVGWLVLLPFALVNVAYWARPGIDRQSGTRTATAVVVRWAGLLVTMAFVCTVCLLSMDLIAWQCYRGGGRVCALPGWVPAGVLDILADPRWNAAPQRLALAALAPLAVVAVLYWLSSHTRRRYEAVPDEGPTGSAIRDDDDHDGDIILRRERMWKGECRLRRQQVLHAAAALVVVVASLTTPILAAGQRHPALIAALALALVALCLGVAGSWLSVPDGNDFNVIADGRRADLVARLSLLSATFGLGLALFADAWLLRDADVDETRDFFDGDLMLGLIFLLLGSAVGFLIFAHRSLTLAVGAAVLGPVIAAAAAVVRTAVPDASSSVPVALVVAVGTVALVALGVRLHNRPGAERLAWSGAAPAVMLGAGLLVALLFTVAALVGAADVLNGGRPVTAIESSYRLETAASAPIATGPPRVVTAEGPITITGGVVVRQGEKISVHRGTIAAAGLRTMVAGSSRPIPGFTLAVGRIAVDGEAIALEGSCVARATVGASAIDPAAGCRTGTDVLGTYIDRGSLTVQAAVEVAGPVQITVTDPPQDPLVLSNAMLWSATLLPFWLLAVVIGLAEARWRFRRTARPGVAEQLAADADGPRPIAADDRPRCRDARLSAAFVHRAEHLIGRTGVISVTGFFVLFVGVLNGRPPWEELPWLRTFGNAGLYCAVGLGAGLVWLASRVRSSDTARRQAGILWDIATFWPRVGHPFGPPSYGERVVPELTRRVRERIAAGDQVLLSGHSQGSVIAVAVAARLGGELGDLSLITYGSQLRGWFGRIFPAVLGPGPLGTGPTGGGAAVSTQRESLRTRLGARWLNLFRRTDPIGFPVFAERGDPSDIYVMELDDRYDLATHSGYQFTAEYARAVERLADR